MLKTSFRVAMILVFALSLFGVANVKAQQGGLTFTSGVQVVNLSDSPANITLYYYSPGTADPVATFADTTPIPAHGSKTYFPLQGPTSGFNGSMVIESDVQVAAISNLVTTDFAYNASTTGFSGDQASTTFNLPLVMCNNSGYNTFFSIQNAGATTAHVTVTYNPGSNGKTGLSDTADILAGNSKTFDQAVGSTSGTKTCTDLQDPTGKFIGSASITSDVPVVATVMELNTTNPTYKALLGYNGFSAGSQTVNLPLVMSKNGGFYTGIQVMNEGDTATDVTITYSPNIVSGGFNPVTETCPALAPGKSCTKIQNDGQWQSRYVGGATITNSAGQNLVAIVNQVSYTNDPAQGPFGDAYEGFNPASATGSVSAPLVAANNNGFYTGIQIQNAGSAPCDVTVTYSPNTVGTWTPQAEHNASLAPGASWNIIQNSAPPSNGSVNDFGTNRYIGSAEITGTGCQLFAIIDYLRQSTGDNLMGYDGFNH